MNSEKLKEWSEWLDSEAGQKSLSNYVEKINNENVIKESQLARFNTKFGGLLFSEIIEKIQAKYESDKYINYWYSKGFEPPKSLYFFLLDYAEKYGREATEKEYEEFGNMFTSSMFVCNDYFVSRMDGQGSVVHIWKSGSSCR